ncbi:restriction endonuclease subunit S [Geobacillus subterraneus]|uniref:restriction endonuclease subunit S n=1 Tax=Geobacillus subterraneus TaxID=129338 RepID=UPI002AC9269D|nr:restriction endonuclease subunit S [Geobacillus subterraneus]WPZ18736.1 restriction endonuclease subunit S [Geobacillus subterraneus]
MSNNLYRLSDICSPKQWKTISMNQLTDEGYPVYGANGIIGYYSEYTHTEETILITCRGATCGEINICQPYSYVTGNAMALDSLDKEKVDLKYLYYYLKYRGFKDVISGSAQPQITRNNISKIKIYLPDKNRQMLISRILDKAQELIDKRKAQIEALDQLTQSVFLEILFRNPEKNTRIKFAEIIKETKNGISRRGNEEIGNIVLRLRDIKENLIDYTDINRIKLNETEKENFRVNLNDLLLIRVNGNPDYVGRSAVFTGYSEEVFFNDHIIRIKTNEFVENIFLAYYLNSYMGKKELRKNLKTSAGQYTISREGLNKVNIILPPLEDQKYFVHWFKVIQEKKQLLQQSLVELNNTFNSLVQRAFKGELFND